MKLNKTLRHPYASKSACVLAAGVLLSMHAWAGPAANALPTGGNVQAGQATISQSQNTLNINQTSQRAVVGWDAFNVGKDATVNFNQPNANASTLNIVNGASKSMINGALNSNGQVIFVNPNGVVFGKNAEVNVGGLVATTMKIDPNAYMADGDTQTYKGNGTGKVVNKGHITVNDIKGYVALMAPEVVNEGVIKATLSGKNAVALVSGEQVTIQIQDRQMLSINVDASSIKSLIQNKRLIQVESGQVLLAANSAKDLKNSVVQNTGVISATGITSNGGVISLRAGTVIQTGTVAANSTSAVGGEVSITGNQITLDSGSVTSATGAKGGGQILVGTTLVKPDASALVAKIVDVKSTATVDASATQSGNGGTISIWSTQTTSVAGILSAKGGSMSGHGGLIETSSSGLVTYGNSLVVDTTAANGKTGTWTTDPLTITIDSAAASALTRALSTTNVVLDATFASCGGVGTCSIGTTPSITFVAGADIYSSNSLTSLTLNALGGNINIQSNIAVGQVYAVAQEISVSGSINSTGGANGQVYLAGAALNILGQVGSNGSTGSSTSGSSVGSGTSTGTRRRANASDALATDTNSYTSDAGKVTLIATGDITIGSISNSTTSISANGINGGAVTIVSLNGNIKNYGVVDALGLNGTGGIISIAASQKTDLVGALMSVDGLHQGGVFQIGVANAVGTGATLAPPSINAQVATLLAAINFSPTVNSTLLSAQTVIDSATLITANAQASALQATNFSTAGSIYLAGNDLLNTSATITANADVGGVILLSSPAGIYQNAGYIQTNGGAGLGGTIAQSGLISTTLTNATLEANGQLGGGNIVTGRDFQANPIPNSANQGAWLPVLSSVVHFPTSALTVVDAASSLSANATGPGNAGNVLVWGDNLAALGTFNAQAQGISGNGGFIETSGNQLFLNGINVSASAAGGSSGLWLLDPFDVTIAATGPTGTTYAASFSAGVTSTILASSIVTSLNAGTHVSISTGSNSANTIYVTTPISATTGGGGSLTLTAGTINLQQNITTAGAQTYNGAVTLGGNITLTTTNSSVIFGSTVNGANSLTLITGSGEASFVGSVGATTALESLTVTGVSGNSTGQTTTFKGNVTTTSSQSYGGNLAVSATVVLTSGSGNVDIDGDVNIAQYFTGVLKFLGGGAYSYKGASYNDPETPYNVASDTTSPLRGQITYAGGNYAFTPTSGGSVSSLVVGGGGGGGSTGDKVGGGGGGGGVISQTITLTAGQTVTVIVGSGGASNQNGNQSSITPTSLGAIVAYGGGAGASSSNRANLGLTTVAGGGGATHNTSRSPGVGGSQGTVNGVATGTAVSGSLGYDTGTNTNGNFMGGSGGGAGGETTAAIATYPGAAANGVASSITGTSTYYGGGGTGGCSYKGANCEPRAGGAGGGGSGGRNGSPTNGLIFSPSAGAANTGGGGGGAATYSAVGTTIAGGAGGSGLVVIKGTASTISASLTINAGSGRATIGGAVSKLTTLTINSTAGTSSIGGMISTATALQFNTGTAPSNYTGVNSVAAVLLLSGNNTYTGGTTVSGGTLQAGSATAFGATSGAITVNSGAALDLNGKSLTNTNALTLNGTGISAGGALTNSSASVGAYAGAVTLGATASSIGSSNGTITVSGSISGTTGLTVNGAAGQTATVKLSGNNNYTGGTAVSGGTLQAGSATAFGASTSAVIIQSGAVLDLNGTTMTGINALTLNGTGINSGGALINSSATGSTYVGLLSLGSSSYINAETGTIAITNSGTITGATFTLTLGGAQGGSVASIIGTTSGAVTKQGAGTWTLTGANTYAGGTAINGGVLSIASGGLTATNLSTGAVTLSGGILLDTATSTIGNLIILGAGTNTIAAASARTATFSNVISGVANSVVIGYGGNNGTVVLGGANTYSGNTNLSVGTLVVADDSALSRGSLTMAASTVLQAGATTVSLSNPIAMSGAATINAPTANTLTLSGALSGAGTPIINNGTTGTVLFTNSANTFGSATNATNITISGGILGIVADGSLGAAPSSVQAASIKLSGGVLQAYGLPTETIATTVTLGTNRGISMTAASGLAATATTTNGTTYIDSLQVPGIVTGAYALTINGASQAGTVKLSGANTYSGGTTITSGTVIDASATGLGSSTAALTLSNAAKLDLQNALSVASLSMSAGSQIVNTGGTSSLTVAGVSSLGNAVTTTGTQTYNGNITLNGNTSLTAGLFSFTGSTTSGAYALSLLPYRESFSAPQSLAGLTLATSTTSFTLGASGNSAAATLPVAITISGPITVYAGAINVNANLSDTAASANAGIQLIGSGAFTLASTKTVTTTNAGIVVAGSQIVINNSASNAIAAGGTGNYWNIWSSNASPYNSTSSLADNPGGLIYDFKQYNITYGASVLGAGNGLMFSFAPTLSISLTGSVTKAYDATNIATVASGNYVLLGNVSGDVITYTKPTSGTYASTDVSTNILVSTTDIALSSATSSTGKTIYGYQLASTSASGNVGVITAKQLTATFVANNKVYDATSDATGTLTLSGFVGSDTGTVTASAMSFASANVAYSGASVAAQTVTATGLTLGTGLSNYALASTTVTRTATITPAPLSITATNQAGFVTQAPALSNTAFIASGLIGAQSITSVTLTTTATSASSANNYPIAISSAVAPVGTTLGNYNITYTPGTYTVVPAGGLLISTNGVSTVYGTNASVAPVSISYQSSGGASITTISSFTTSTVGGVTKFVFVDGASGTVSFSLAPTATTSSASGNINVNSYGLLADNLTTTSSNLAANAPLVVTGNYTVTPKSVTVAATAATSTYTAIAQNQAYTSGLLSGDSVTVNGLASAINAGTYSSNLSVTGVDKNNYTLAFSNANFTISPAALTVRGSTNTVTYNAAPQTNRVAAVTGFLGSDSGSVTGYASGTNAASYSDSLSVTASGGTLLSNYAISITNGTLTINKAPITVTGSATTGTYSALTQTNAAPTVVGAQGSDAFSITGLASAKNVGAYADNLAVAATGSTLLSNYTITKTNGSLAISKADLSVTAANNTVTYSAAIQTNSGATLSGVLGSDSFAVNGYGAGRNTGTYNDALSLSGVGGTLTSNYNISYNNGSLTVTPAALTVTGASSTRTYTSAAQTNNFTTTGLLSPDTVTGVSGLASRTNVGTSADLLSNATGSGLSNYTISYVNGSMAVTPALLTITGAATTRVYTAAVQTNTFGTSGLLGSDSVSAVSGAASAIQVGTVADQLSNASGTGLSNYTISYVNGLLTITQAPLTITGSTTTNRVYTSTLQTNTYTTSGLLRSDAVTGVSGLATGTNVGTTNDSLSGATGSGLSNYNIAYVNGSLTITPAPLTITGATTSSTYTALAQTNSYSARGLLGPDTVTGVTGLATRTDAGTTADSLSSATGTGLGNYTIAYVNGSLAITPAPLTVTGATTSNVYSSAAQTNNFSVSGLLGNDTVTGVTGLASSTNVGTVADTLSAATGQGITNYTVRYVNGSLTITPAPLTIAANNTASFVTKSTEALSYTASGLLGTDSISSVSLSTTAASNSAAGTYPISISNAVGSALGNYSISYQPATYTVVPAGQLLITTAGTTATYATPVEAAPVTVSYLSPTDNTTIGNLSQTSSVTTNGVTTYNYSDLLSIPTTVSFSLGANSPVLSGSGNLSVGVYGLSAVSFTKAGPSLTSNNATVTGSSVVNPLAVTVTGAITSKAYTSTLQTAAPTVNSNGYISVGLVSGDDLFVSGVASGTNVGTYQSTLAVAGNDAGNYAITIANNSLTITPVDLTITGGNTSSRYNATTQTNSAALSISGLKGNDAVTGITGRATGKDVGTYTDALFNATGSGLGNYAITYVNGSLTVTPAPLTAVVAADNKVYDATTNATGALSLTGVFTNDPVSAAASGISFADAQAGSAKAVTASNISISGAASNNYSLTNTSAAATADITPAPLTITGSTTSSVYNGGAQTNASSFTTSGLFGTDQVTSVTGQASGKNVGTFTDTLINAVGSGLSNYSIAYSNGALTINPAALRVTGTTTAVTYNGNQQTNSYQVSGLQASEGVTVTGVATGLNAGAYNDSLVVSANTGTLLSNYTLTTTNGSLTIAQAPLTAVLSANDKMYDATTSATGTVALRGLFGSDVVVGTPTAIAFSDANVGTAKSASATGVSLSGAAASNYVLTSSTASGQANITPAPLTVAANNQAGFVTQALNLLTYSVTGLLGNDAVSSANMLTNAGPNTSAGTYALSISNAQGSGVSNYTITYQAGTYTVVPAGQVLIATNGSSSTYGATLTAPTSVTASYLDPSNSQINVLILHSSNISNGVTTYVFSDGAGGFVNATLSAQNPITSGSGKLSAGIYGIGVGTFSKTGTNLISDTATVTGDYVVTPLATTITANDQARVYNGGLQTASFTSSGLLAQDHVLVAGRASGTSVGSYGSNLAASGTDVGNYVFTYDDRSFAITPAVLTVTGVTTSSVYSAIQKTNTFTTSGLLGTDSVTAVSGQASGINVGTYNDALSGATGTGLGNYTITYTNGAMSITPASLTITGSTTSRVYSATTQANASAFTTSGLLGGDSVTAVSGQASGINVGTYNDALSGATGTGLGNYTITYTNGAMSITSKALQITGSNSSKIATGSVLNNSTAFTTSGLVGLDLVSAVSGQASGTNAGTYADNLTDATGTGLSNYSITYVNGALEIKPAPANAAANAASALIGGGSNFSTVGLPNVIIGGSTPSSSIASTVTTTEPSSSVTNVSNSVASLDLATSEVQYASSGTSIKVMLPSFLTGGVQGIKITIDFVQSQYSEGTNLMVVIEVPKLLTQSKFEIPLPNEAVVYFSNTRNSDTLPLAKLATGDDLPEWIKFDPETLKFVIEKGQSYKLPLKVEISLGEKRIAIDLIDLVEN